MVRMLPILTKKGSANTKEMCNDLPGSLCFHEPRFKAVDVLTEPLEIHGLGNRAEREELAAKALEAVALHRKIFQICPYARGGQRQRLATADSDPFS